MKLDIDTEKGIIEVAGLKISIELLANLAAPNPHYLYSLVRKGDVVTVAKFEVGPEKPIAVSHHKHHHLLGSANGQLPKNGAGRKWAWMAETVAQ